MKISNNLRTLKLNSDSLYQIGYFLLILNQVLAQSQYNEIGVTSLLLKVSRWFLICFFGILIFKKGKYPYNRKGFFWIVFSFISLVEMAFFNGKLLLIIMFLLVISSYKVEMNALIRNHVSALVVGVIIVVLSSFIGILDTLGVYKQFDNVTGFLFKQNNIRYAFGFINSNIIPITGLYLYLYVILIKRDSYKFFYDIVAVLLNYIIFLYCGSRVCILLVLLTAILRWGIVFSRRWFVRLLVPADLIILIGCLFFSLLLPISSFYSTPIVTVIDRIFTARITIIRNVLSKYPITLWGYGDIVTDNSAEYLVLDNGYIALFVKRGIIIGIIFIVFLIMMIWNAKRNSDAYLLLFISIMIIGNIIDNSILHYITFPIYILSFNGLLSANVQKYLRGSGIYG